ncbi:MAG TPA: GDSL-type esterase/lipase family protein [Alphaproteobacteria bacterium]|nr:GDSL-type esterase/lipase family protein [Alphaproteobacteria bacterium]
MRGVWQRVALAALVVVIVGPSALRAEPKEKLSKTCQVPNWIAETSVPLPNARHSLKREKQLKIVALGSSSTLGSGGSGPDAAWPAQLATALSKRMPDAKITVVNKAEMRQSVPQMLARLDKDVLAEKPSMVIWEAGTSEAVRHADIDAFTADLLLGIDRLASNKIDVVLMDMQYARDTARIINFQPYVDAMGRSGMMRNIFVFPRYDIMRDWVENEQVSFEHLQRADAIKTADVVYACLGKLLAELLANSLAK